MMQSSVERSVLVTKSLYVPLHLCWFATHLFELLSCVLRLRRSWLLFRKSALTESNTCWTVRREKSTPSTWRAFVWVSITWVLWTTLKMTTDETITLHHPPSFLVTHPFYFYFFEPFLLLTVRSILWAGACTGLTHLRRPLQDNMLDNIL